MAWRPLNAFEAYGGKIYNCTPGSEIDTIIRGNMGSDGRIDVEYHGSGDNPAWDHTVDFGNVSPELTEEFLTSDDITVGTYGNLDSLGYESQYIEEGYTIRFKDPSEGVQCGIGRYIAHTGAYNADDNFIYWYKNWDSYSSSYVHAYINQVSYPYVKQYDTQSEQETAMPDVSQMFNQAINFSDAYYLETVEVAPGEFRTFNMPDAFFRFAIYLYTNDEGLIVPVFVEQSTEKSFGEPVTGYYQVRICQRSYYTELGGAELYNLIVEHIPTPPAPSGNNPYSGDTFDGTNQRGGRDIGDTASDFGKTDTTLPVLQGTESGFFTAYKVNETNLKAMAERLWETTFVDAVVGKYRDVGGMINALYMLPFSAKTDKNDFRKWYNDSEHMEQMGGGGFAFTGDAKGQRIIERYVKLKFGKVKINSRWDAYPDYGEFKQVRIYIPYCGEFELDVNTLMSKYKNVTIGEGDDAIERVEIIDGVKGCTGCELSLEYVVDVFTGVCVALVKINDLIRYQFTGNMQMGLPWSWASRESAIGNMMGAAASVGAGLAIGGPLGLAVSVIGSAANTLEGAAKMGAKQAHSSGSFAGLPGAMQLEYPYVTVFYPSIVTGSNQDNYIGRATPCTTALGSYSGFVQAEAIHLDNITATDDERAEIERMVKEGVII